MARALRAVDLEGLRQVVDRTRPVTLSGERVLPVLGALAPLLVGGGLRRGSTVAVDAGPGATSLGLALCAGASRAGSWTAVVTEGTGQVPSVGAGADLGVDPRRTAVLAVPALAWPSTLATLVDAVELVVLVQPPELRAADLRRLDARQRERGAVLVVVGGHLCSLPVDVRLSVVGSRWQGLEAGHGRLRNRVVTVEAVGRGAAARARQCLVQLPDASGAVADAPRAAPPLVSAPVREAAG